MKKTLLVLGTSLLLSTSAIAQEHHKGKLIEYKNPFWDGIKESVTKYQNPEEDAKKSFKVDLEGWDLPKSTDEFTSQWHNAPISQGWSGMCWCFATTSMLESDIKRRTGQEVKISELHTIYYEYQLKVEEFVRTRGKSTLGEGSQGNAVLRVWDKYGCVPAEAFTGMKEGMEYHGHNLMFEEINKFMHSMKQTNSWDPEYAQKTVRAIMDHYIGTPPKEFTYKGKKYNPITFRDEVAKFKKDDYVDIMSLMQQGYWDNVVYPAADNWWKCDKYKNVPLDDFMVAVKKAITDGYSMMIGGDVSSTGYYSFEDVAVIPSYDIPSEYIDEHARQLRWSNGTTGDDHAIHLVGYTEKDDVTWYLIKDSGSGSRNGNNKGYYFYHEDYVKLKMMNFLVHKEAVKDLLEKFDKNKK